MRSPRCPGGPIPCPDLRCAVPLRARTPCDRRCRRPERTVTRSPAASHSGFAHDAGVGARRRNDQRGAGERAGDPQALFCRFSFSIPTSCAITAVHDRTGGEWRPPSGRRRYGATPQKVANLRRQQDSNHRAAGVEGDDVFAAAAASRSPRRAVRGPEHGGGAGSLPQRQQQAIAVRPSVTNLPSTSRRRRKLNPSQRQQQQRLERIGGHGRWRPLALVAAAAACNRPPALPARHRRSGAAKQRGSHGSRGGPSQGPLPPGASGRRPSGRRDYSAAASTAPFRPEPGIQAGHRPRRRPRNSRASVASRRCVFLADCPVCLQIVFGDLDMLRPAQGTCCLERPCWPFRSRIARWLRCVPRRDDEGRRACRA